MTRFIYVAWLSLMAIALMGCAPQNIDTDIETLASPALTQVYNGQQCRLNAGVTQLTQQDLPLLNRSRLLTEQDAGAGRMPVVPDNTGLLIAISRGEQTSSGYGFTLAGTSVKADGGLQIELTWQQPPKDGVSLTVMTHPCIVLAVPSEIASQLGYITAKDATGGIGKLNLETN